MTRSSAVASASVGRAAAAGIDKARDDLQPLAHWPDRAMLAGIRVKDSHTGQDVDLADPRVKTAIMFSPPGDGADAASTVAERPPELVSNDSAT